MSLFSLVHEQTFEAHALSSSTPLDLDLDVLARVAYDAAFANNQPITFPAPPSLPSLTLYVLHLKGDKYYVGTTRNLRARLTQHFSGVGGALWTKIHEPIACIATTQQDVDFLLENMITKRYMKQFGIDNVRGGRYADPKLTPEQVKFINQELYEGCYGCKTLAHSHTECPNRSRNYYTRKNLFCQNCCKNGHTDERCYNSHVVPRYPIHCPFDTDAAAAAVVPILEVPVPVAALRAARRAKKHLKLPPMPAPIVVLYQK